MVIVIYVENMDITPKIVQKGGKAEVEVVPQAEAEVEGGDTPIEDIESTE